MDADDVRMPEFGRKIGLALEPSTVVGVGGHIGWEHLQRVTARQPGVLGQINLAHPARTQQAHDPEAREGLTVPQRHDD
jgi:hypothetical protein